MLSSIKSVQPREVRDKKSDEIITTFICLTRWVIRFEFVCRNSEIIYFVYNLWLSEEFKLYDR